VATSCWFESGQGHQFAIVSYFGINRATDVSSRTGRGKHRVSTHDFSAVPREAMRAPRPGLRRANYESGGQEFESLRARHKSKQFQSGTRQPDWLAIAKKLVGNQSATIRRDCPGSRQITRAFASHGRDRRFHPTAPPFLLAFQHLQ
jgi:hypothetical protein